MPLSGLPHVLFNLATRICFEVTQYPILFRIAVHANDDMAVVSHDCDRRQFSVSVLGSLLELKRDALGLLVTQKDRITLELRRGVTV